MGELEDNVHELEMRIYELEQQIEHIEEFHLDFLDENDVRAVVDDLLVEKNIATREEIERQINKSQLSLTKWIIGTGISIGALVVSIVQFF
jgi:regulator of replication initiation timing